MPSALLDNGDSRIRIPAESKDGLTPKSGPQYEDLRGVAIQPTLQEWRNLSRNELEAMQRQHYVQRTAADIK